MSTRNGNNGDGKKRSFLCCISSARNARETTDEEYDFAAGNGNGTMYEDDPSGQSKLKVIDIEVDKTFQQNRVAHHTDEFDSKQLILRRGQSFDLSIILDRSFNKDTDEISVEFATGKYPSYSKGTKFRVELKEEIEDGVWNATSEVDKDERILHLKVQSACSAPIGYYTMSIITKVDESREFAYPCAKRIYFLFNPWCEKDSVYLEGKDEKDEYVLNETGYLWYGSYNSMACRAWVFGQFEEAVFEAVMYLLQDCKFAVMDRDRGNPVVVARKMSALVNVQDDGGVVTGRWDNAYGDGIPPGYWNSSVAILERYMKYKTPVKYGQCWVFSAVLTTVLRCLGIPARSVTNFASAHDTDGSMTIDTHFDEGCRPLRFMDRDSVWNFHLWNDCWMARPDLPPGYGGWQAVDATPQETSDGVYQTGPASVVAIKQGHVYLPYDGRFVFAEINGDEVYWQVSGNVHSGHYKLTKIREDPWAIGRCLYTKAVGRNEGVDVKEEYKHPDGSPAERLAVETAVQYGTKPATYQQATQSHSDVDFKISAEENVHIGSDFQIELLLTNKSDEQRTANLHVNLQMCYYTGVVASLVKSEWVTVSLAPGGQRKTSVKVTIDKYLEKLVDHSTMKIFAMGKVEETSQLLASQDDLRLRTPNIDLSVSKAKVKVNEEFTVRMTLKNPLPKTLTNCEFNLEGAGVIRTMDIKQKDIAPHAEVTQEVKLHARKKGKRTMVVDFDSDWLSHVHGDVDVEVYE